MDQRLESGKGQSLISASSDPLLAPTVSAASSANWRRPSVCSRATAKPRRQEGEPQPTLRPRLRKPPLQRDDAGAGTLPLQKRPPARARHRASAIRCLPWQPAKRSRKSPLHAKALAQTTSASSLPDTNGLVASKSATGNSTPRRRPGQSNTPRFDSRDKRIVGREGSGIGDEPEDRGW